MAAKLAEQGIFLTFDEIRILMYGLGKTKIEGVWMPEKEFTEQDVLAAMHHLSKAGFIIARDDRFVMREDVQRIMEIAASPDDTEIWRPCGAQGPAYFLYYAGKNVVVSERFWRKKDTVRYALFGVEEFGRIRQEYSIRETDTEQEGDTDDNSGS